MRFLRWIMGSQAVGGTAPCQGDGAEGHEQKVSDKTLDNSPGRRRGQPGGWRRKNWTGKREGRSLGQGARRRAWAGSCGLGLQPPYRGLSQAPGRQFMEKGTAALSHVPVPPYS